jgi:hypothetical protein
MVAGDPGQVDIVYYKSNTGLNPNIAFFDDNGNSCDPDTATGPCHPNQSAWNVIFGQSQNALNMGSNFKNVQISDHPVHIGQVCTAGLLCLLGGDRQLLDFLTVDVDHLGAAVVSWTDTNDSFEDRRVKVSRQVSGNSVFKNQTIGLQSSWPIRDHAVSDSAGDVFNEDGAFVGPCTGMDVRSTSASRSGDLLTVSMTLIGTPTSGNAMTCGGLGQVTGGIWGAEFWASNHPNDNFYVAYRDNSLDGSAAVEAGRMNNLNEPQTALEFDPTTAGTPATPGGTCFPTPVTTACTITLSVSLSSLGIKAGAGLYSITGLSAYLFGKDTPVPTTRRTLQHSEQADVTPALDYNGTGTTK